MTKQNNGRPAYCPRCNSKKIVYDTLMNNQLGFMIGIGGLVLFYISYIDTFSSRNFFMIIGLLGILVLIGTILNTYDNYHRNKMVLKQISK